MRLLILLLLITNLLAACNDTPGSNAMPAEEHVATGVPTSTARPTAGATSSPTSAATMEYQGVSLSYNELLLGPLEEAVRSPAKAAGVDLAQPQNITFAFRGADQVAGGKLHVFPLDHYLALSEAAANHITNLEHLLANKPVILDSPIPLYPTTYTVDDFLLHPFYVEFNGGYGVGFIASIDAGGEFSMVYAFQGITNDRASFITTILPITGENVGQNMTQTENETLAPVADKRSAFEAKLTTTLENLNETLSTLSIQLDNEQSVPAPEAYFSIPGVLLGYDPQLSGIPSVEQKPPVYNSDDGESVFLPGVPDAITITFESERIETKESQSPSLTIQPLRGGSGQYYDSIPDEQKQKVAAIEMAFTNNERAAEPTDNERLFAFQSGIGKRLVENNEPSKIALYQFQGVTSDRRYFVDFKHPMQSPEVSSAASSNGESTTTQVYHEQLTQLDQMVQSLVIAADASTESTMPINSVACTHDAQFVEDVALPDYSIVDRGHEVVKIWRIRNTGTCSWTPAYQIQFAGGNPIPWSKPSVIDVVNPGDATDISVKITAPEVPGIYHAWWQLADDFGNPFGPYYHAIFESPQPATDIPGYGVVEGELKYPASGVPALTIYFLSTDGSQRFALETEDGWNRYANELPVGEYFVFAKVIGDDSGSGGGYTESVLCDMKCDDHALIPVTIEEGLATREINILDWYAPAGTFPFP